MSQENLKGVVHMTKSVEATRAHLQGQLRSKEAENNRLHVQLRVRDLSVTVISQQIKCLKYKTVRSVECQGLKKKTDSKDNVPGVCVNPEHLRVGLLSPPDC